MKALNIEIRWTNSAPINKNNVALTYVDEELCKNAKEPTGEIARSALCVFLLKG